MQAQDQYKAQIQQAKVDRKIAKYSQDYDMSVVIKSVLGTFALLMVLVMILELVAVVALGKEPGVYFKEAMIVGLFAYLAGWISAMVTFYFTKKGLEKQPVPK